MPFLDFNLQLNKSTIAKWLFLRCLSAVYSVLINCWLYLYRSGIRKGYKPDKPVISVGNITIGGTGKTPMIDWLLNFSDQSNLRASVLTRGYRSEKTDSIILLDSSSKEKLPRNQFGDEPWLLHERHPHVPVYIGADRVNSARLAEKKADILLLDDGMQHLKLERDINIVLIDSLAGTGNGKMFPLGPLREPMRSLKRADILVYTRTNLKSSAEIRQKLRPYLSNDIVQFDAEFQIQSISSSKSSREESPDMLKGKKCMLFSGIGNPKSFEEIIRQHGGIIVDHLVLGDHHPYDNSTIEELNGLESQSKFDLLICTEKDWVKIEQKRDQLPEIHYLKMIVTIDPLFTETITDLLHLREKKGMYPECYLCFKK